MGTESLRISKDETAGLPGRRPGFFNFFLILKKFQAAA
jgi:hypothetical protein